MSICSEHFQSAQSLQASCISAALRVCSCASSPYHWATWRGSCILEALTFKAPHNAQAELPRKPRRSCFPLHLNTQRQTAASGQVLPVYSQHSSISSVVMQFLFTSLNGNHINRAAAYARVVIPVTEQVRVSISVSKQAATFTKAFHHALPVESVKLNGLHSCKLCAGTVRCS